MPSRRRFYYYDEEAESFDEIHNPRPEEEYIDFRTYPIKINWPEVENPDSEAHDIFDKYGYLGVALLNCLSSIRSLKLQTSNKFLHKIVDFYVRNSDKLDLVSKVISSLPSLSSLLSILEQDLLSKKEQLSFKILLDIYEHYLKKYDSPSYLTLLSQYIPVALKFYSSLSEDNCKSVYKLLASTDNRDLYDNLVKKMNCSYEKSKFNYVNKLRDLKSTLVSLSGGIENIKFCK